MTPEAKTVNFSERWFNANGKKYYISDKISVRRWKEYEKLVPRLTYGVDFDSMSKSLLKAYTALDKQKFADAAVVMHNLMNGIKDVNDETRVHPALLIAALLINAEGEDAGDYNHDLQLSKIEDWQKEGLNILDFFRFAVQSINGFRETYKSYIQNQAEEVLQKEAKSK